MTRYKITYSDYINADSIEEAKEIFMEMLSNDFRCEMAQKDGYDLVYRCHSVVYNDANAFTIIQVNPDEKT